MDSSLDRVLERNLSNPFGTRLILQSNEQIKSSYDGMEVVSEWEAHEGIFLLTSRRIVFQTKRSFSSPNDLNLPLSEIEAVSVERGLAFRGSFQPALKIQVSSTRKLLFVLEPSSPSEPELNVLVQALIRLKELDEEKQNAPRQTVNLTTDFSWLKDFLKNGGYVMASYKCPNCGGAIDIPKEGDSTKCEHCGLTVYAVDVIKRARELIK